MGLSTSRSVFLRTTEGLAVVRTWYADKLDLTPDQELPDAPALVYRGAGGGFTVYETPNAGTAKNTAAGWVVQDLDAVMADLRGRSVGPVRSHPE